MRSSRLRRVFSIGCVLAIAAFMSPRATLALSCVALALIAAAAVVVYVRIRRSRPLLNGTIAAAGLDSPVAISRDAGGIPIVSGATRGDVAFGLGFLHAQERFFQMDMSRRAAAGELAALLGKAYVIADRRARIHQFRKRAQRIEAALPADQRELLDAYTAGVREGLRHLHAPPIEYLFLRTRPQQWRPEDTLLVVFNWYRLLQDEAAEQDFQRYLLYASLPQIVADFLVPEGSPDWDAPLVGPRTDPVPVPSPDHFDLRRAPPQRCPEAQLRFAPVPGSNAWAVAGEHTKSGKAIVANDMHLPYAMPATFYRATLELGESQPRVRLSGLTMPGFPFLVAGTNGRIAWGLANAAVDAMHLVRLDQTDLAAHAYRTTEGVEDIQSERETIQVRGETDVVMTVKQTRFGPISRKASDGALFAQSWVAYDAESVSFAWHALETAASVEQAMDAANRLRVPTLAIVIGDELGDVGWTLAGSLPRPSRLPLSSTEPAESSRDQVPLRYPRFGSPELSRVWAANARAVTRGPVGDLLAHGYHVCGARASQIRDALLAVEVADEISMLRIQCDDRALFLTRWHALLVETLRSRRANHSRVVEVRAALDSWNGRASADSVAYRIVNQFRDTVARLAFEPFISIVRARHGHFDLATVSDQLEVPLWRLVSERPPHLLAPWFTDWEALITAAASDAIEGAPLPWGAANRLEMRHPLSSFVPLLGRLFDAPAAPLHGDLHMPLAQTATHGPVFRFVITAGNEHDAIAHMAGGQAANRSAPYYLNGHDAWLEGRPAPLAPGPTRYALTLKPLPSCNRKPSMKAVPAA